jgi:hypothetical protein
MGAVGSWNEIEGRQFYELKVSIICALVMHTATATAENANFSCVSYFMFM